jgi:hypothetical protein
MTVYPKCSFNPNPNSTWLQYHAAYLRWMQKVSHPDLSTINYNADKFKERIQHHEQVIASRSRR